MLGSDVAPFLKIGETKALRHWLGKEFDLKLASKKYERGKHKTLANFLRIALGRPSGPNEVLGLIPIRVLYTDSTEKWTVSILIGSLT